jgi:hypothetical protein
MMTVVSRIDCEDRNAARPTQPPQGNVGADRCKQARAGAEAGPGRVTCLDVLSEQSFKISSFPTDICRWMAQHVGRLLSNGTLTF